MLSILDRYIIKKFLATFFFATILITVVSIVIHFAENIGRYIDKDIPMSEVVVDYYVHFVPWINGLLWPLFIMISVMFFTARMAKNTEIIPMFSSGLSFFRILKPYLLSSFLLAGMHWYAYNYVIPISNKYKNEFENERLNKKREQARSTNVHFFISGDAKIFIRYFRRRDSTGQNFRLETFDVNGNIVELLKAKKIYFKERPYTWTLEDYVQRKILYHPPDSNRKITIGSEESIVVGKGEKLDTTLNFTPEDFVEHLKQMEIMPTQDLTAFLKQEESRGIGNTKKFYIELSKRNAIPFSIVILTIIAVAVSSRKVRGGMGLHMAIGVVIGSAFELLSKFSTTFAANLDLPISFCIWIPNMIFTVVAGVLVWKAQK